MDEEARIVLLLDIEMHKRMKHVRYDAPNVENVYKRRLDNLCIKLDGIRPIACWYFDDCDICSMSKACDTFHNDKKFNDILAELEEKLRKEL